MTLSLEKLGHLLEQPKTISQPPRGWAPASYKNSTQLEVLSALEVEDVVLEGLSLRCNCIQEQPDKAVTFQIEYELPGRRKRTPLARIDWRPLRPHNNKGFGPAGFRYIQQVNSHIHEFSENLNSVGERAFQPQENLPVAIPLTPEPETFEQLLAILRDRFKISNAMGIPLPQWEYRLQL